LAIFDIQNVVQSVENQPFPETTKNVTITQKATVTLTDSLIELPFQLPDEIADLLEPFRTAGRVG
jgi:hypothetical protein